MIPGPYKQALSVPMSPLSCSRDLKRDVAKKLEKLEKRTQRAIAELIRKCGLASGVLLSGQCGLALGSCSQGGGVLLSGQWFKHHPLPHVYSPSR